MSEELVPMLFRLSVRDKARLQAYSKRTRISMSAIIYNALIHYLEENETVAERARQMSEQERL